MSSVTVSARSISGPRASTIGTSDRSLTRRDRGWQWLVHVLVWWPGRVVSASEGAVTPSLTSITASTHHAVLAILAVLLVAALDWITGRELGLSLFFLAVVWLSATRQAPAGERERARTDALTGILNQDGFAEAARRRPRWRLS